MIAMTVENYKAGVFGAQLTSKANNSMEGRNIAVQTFLEQTPFSHLLFIDSDQGFPPDTTLRLLKHDKDIVGATYRRRGGSYDLMMFPIEEDQISMASTGLHEVMMVPTGCVLIKRQVFELQPHSWFSYDPQLGQPGKFMSDDASFCYRMRAEYGLKIYVDMDLSRDVTHVASLQLTYDGSIR